jgi:hypothetical protein
MMKTVRELTPIWTRHRRSLGIGAATVLLLIIALAGLGPIGTSGSGRLAFSAKGVISNVFPLPAGFSIPPGATPIMSINLPSSSPRIAEVKVFLVFSDGSTIPVADENYMIQEIVTTKSSDTSGTAVLTGTVLPGAVSPFPGIVGSASAVSFSFTVSGQSATFQILSATVAGSHTTIDATATGTLTMGTS